jgi:uncharacterized sulfatase
MRTFYLLSLIFFGILSVAAQESEKTNIVFIMADDLTRWDIQPYGSKDAITPTMTQLAEEGIKLNRSYQASPMCSPTRHNLLTGLYPVRSGAYPNHTFVKPGTKSIVQYLKPLGYRVAFSGKRHISPEEIFDFEYLDKNRDDPEPEIITNFFKDVSKKNDPFCLFINFHSPHSPHTMGDRSLFDENKITLPPYLADTPETRKAFVNYLAEINYLDGQLKQILDVLDNSGFKDNTLVIFCTEQGNSLPFAKWTLYNAGVGSGIIARWPGKIKRGTQSDALVEFSDFVPTFIDIAGGKEPVGLDGSSILPVLLGDKQSHKEYTFSLQTTRTILSGAEYYPIRSVSNGEYRLILNLSPEMKFQNVVTERDPYFHLWENNSDASIRALHQSYIKRSPIELYNDAKDPYNMKNLAEDLEYKAIVQHLKTKLDEWMIYCGDTGIGTELEADEHSARQNQIILPVSKIMKLLPKKELGNFEVEKSGYYSFYSPKNGQLNIDGNPLQFGKVEGKKFSEYIVVHLEKGKHNISNFEDLELSWSGPNLKKNKFYKK